MTKDKDNFRYAIGTSSQGRINKTTELFDSLNILTVEQLAELLGKKPQTIRNWVTKRMIPFIPGRPVTFLGASIAAWLKEKEVKPWP